MKFDVVNDFNDILILLSREPNYHLFKKVWKYEKQDAIKFRNVFTITATYKVLSLVDRSDKNILKGSVYND